MKTCLLVHGSPGAPSELNPLRDALVKRDVRAELLRMPMSDRTPVYAPLVEAAASADLIVAYSFGCYLTLLAHQDGALPKKPVCLVSPHLIGNEGLSGAVSFLLGVPGLGRGLIGSGLPKRIDEFLSKTFSPAAAPEVLRKELNDPDLWLRAARWKQLQASSPLRPIDPTSLAQLHIVLAAADSSSPWPEHAGAFTSLPDGALVTRIEGAGHALPFTHPDRVADAALRLLRG